MVVETKEAPSMTHFGRPHKILNGAVKIKPKFLFIVIENNSSTRGIFIFKWKPSTKAYNRVNLCLDIR